MLPDSAPLFIPDIDHTVAQAGPDTFKDKTQDAKKFLAHYLDRRAQMDQVSLLFSSVFFFFFFAAFLFLSIFVFNFSGCYEIYF